jgi:hypothetical protein
MSGEQGKAISAGPYVGFCSLHGPVAERDHVHACASGGSACGSPGSPGSPDAPSSPDSPSSPGAPGAPGSLGSSAPPGSPGSLGSPGSRLGRRALGGIAL